MKTYKCIHDRVMIKPVEKKTQTESGLALPENDQKQDPMGEVVAVGDGVPLHNIKLNITGDLSEESLNKLESIVRLIEKGREMRVKIGDVVQYGGMAATTITIPYDYTNVKAGKYVMVREADCFGIEIEDTIQRLPNESADDYMQRLQDANLTDK
jgi:co-chaperonin GroES (HSP10)